MSWRDLMPVHPAADLFPMLDDAELVALGNDIKANGLASPIIIYSEHIGGKPVLIDGRNRLAALDRVGVHLRLEGPTPRPWRRGAPVYRHYTLITDPSIYCGVHVMSGQLLQEVPFDDPVAYIAAANLHRRHLDAETKRKLVANLLKESPKRSDRATAKIAKVDHKTVGSVRRELEARGDVPHVARRVDSKGRHQPATKRGPADEQFTAINTEPHGGFPAYFGSCHGGRVVSGGVDNDPPKARDPLAAEINRQTDKLDDFVSTYVDASEKWFAEHPQVDDAGRVSFVRFLEVNAERLLQLAGALGGKMRAGKSRVRRDREPAR